MKNTAYTADGFLELPRVRSIDLPSSLFIRQAYKDLQELIHGKYSENTIVVLGNPGIGKSYFSIYEMHRLLKQLKSDEILVYKSLVLDLFIVLDAERILVASRRKDRDLGFINRPPDYYLCDAGTNKGEPTISRSDLCKSIVFSSPDQRNYKDFKKHHLRNLVTLYMPVWSLEELVSLAAQLFDSHQFDL